MENEFIFTVVFALVFLLLWVVMLATDIYGRRKRFKSALDWYKVEATLFMILFLWLLFGVSMIVAFGTELAIKQL